MFPCRYLQSVVTAASRRPILDDFYEPKQVPLPEVYSRHHDPASPGPMPRLLSHSDCHLQSPDYRPLLCCLFHSLQAELVSALRDRRVHQQG